MPAEYFTWSEERVAVLRRLWIEEGYSASLIAREFGNKVTRNAVIGKLHRMGMTRPTAAPLRSLEYPTTRQPPSKPATKTLATIRSSPVKSAPKPPKPVAKARPPRCVPTMPPESIAVAPRHWETRTFGECAWPVDGEGAFTRSCCNPTSATYCPQHQFIMTARAA